MFAFLAKNRHIQPVSRLCEALKVSCFCCHAWHNRLIGSRQIHGAKQVKTIEASFNMPVIKPTAHLVYGAMFWTNKLSTACPDPSRRQDQRFS